MLRGKKSFLKKCIYAVCRGFSLEAGIRSFPLFHTVAPNNLCLLL